ncbi:MAG: hypothetical protein K2P94_08485 [Rhodospirillaceae bacterium]|nr:hypothetical protein [Rhodospirillaceae bacterium]
MTPKSHTGTCMAYVHNARARWFYPVNFTISVPGAEKIKMKGDVAPGRSSRGLVVLFNPATSRNNAISALSAMIAFLEKTRPGAAYAVGVGIGKKSKPQMFIPELEVNAASTMTIKDIKQLEKPAPELPYSVLVIPAGMRHWEDLHNDMHSVKRVITTEGLPRGNIETTIGALTITDREYGNLVAHLPQRERSRFSRPMAEIVDEDYFGLYDEEEEEDEG